MKGKKIDSEFVTSFIENCVNNNILSTEQILQSAKSQINDIDAKIKEVESLKKTRSKLLDVVLTFEQKELAHPKLQDIKILKLFNVKDKNISKIICDKLKLGPFEISTLTSISYPVNDVNFCIKQLLEYKIISKLGKHILCGSMYEDYVSNVLRE